jgi:two-component system chemotaxis family response regulator WspR
MHRFTRQRSRRRVMDAIATPVGDAGFDPVSGLATREKFQQRAESEWTRRAKDHGPMSLLLVGIDNFDAYQGAMGEAAGNDCLGEVAGIIARVCRRRGDFAGRLRAHDFAVLLSETTPKGAERLGEQIRKAVEQLGLGDATAGTRVTVSVGIASVIPKPNRFVESLLKLADAGLGRACDQGGNCVASVRE